MTGEFGTEGHGTTIRAAKRRGHKVRHRVRIDGQNIFQTHLVGVVKLGAGLAEELCKEGLVAHGEVGG